MLNNKVLKKLISFILVLTILSSSIFASENDTEKTLISKTYGEFEIGTVIASSEKMKWIAVDVDGANKDKYLLVTKNIVDVREFNEGHTNYKNSKIRYYLNAEFFEKNFTSEEKNHIVETKIESVINKGSKSEKEETVKTLDKIFLLSNEEVDKYGIAGMKLKANSFAKTVVDENMDGKFWTRDVIYNMYEAQAIVGSYTERKNVENAFGVLVGMWYDFSKVDKKSVVEENNLVERQGGKKSNIEFSNSEKNNTAVFTMNLNYNKVSLGYYETGGSHKKLKWMVLDEDETDYTLLCDSIIEYMELEYDNYDNDVLKNNAYNHSNVKKYLNEELLDKIFTKEDKDLLTEFSNGDFIKIPSLDDVYRYKLLSETLKDTIDLNKTTRDIMGIKKSSSYFVDGEYEENGVTYLLSLILLNKKIDQYYSNFLSLNTVSNNLDRKTNDITYTLTCSGLRPMIKLSKEKCKSKKFSVITTYNSTLFKDKNLKFKDKVKFGKYEQDGDLSNGKEDIVWRVLKKEYKNVLLISDKILDVVDLNDELSVENHYDSRLRSFSNYDFLNEAFDENEEKLLNVVNTYSCSFRTNKITEDRLHSAKTADEGYDKVFSLYTLQNLENGNLMYEDLLKTTETQYVKNTYGEVDSYLKQDLCIYNIDSSDGNVLKIPYYLQITKDGHNVLNKKSSGGFRPIICLDAENAVKYKIN